MHHDQEAAPQARRSGVLLGCLGVGLLVILVGGGGLWWWFSTSFLRDPAAIAALLEDILPGAQVPEGYSGLMGIDTFGQKMVLVGKGPSGEEQQDVAFIMVSAAPLKEGRDVKGELRRAIGEAGPEGSKIEDMGTEPIKVGGVDIVFLKSRLVGADQKPYQLGYAGILPVREGRVTTILIMGPADHFDRKGMGAFLTSVAPLDGDPSTAPRKR